MPKLSILQAQVFDGLYRMTSPRTEYIGLRVRIMDDLQANFRVGNNGAVPGADVSISVCCEASQSLWSTDRGGEELSESPPSESTSVLKYSV